MRPALYYPWVYLKGGAERLLVELLRRSGHEWTLYTNRFELGSTFPELADFPVVRLPEISVRRTLGDVARAGLTVLTQRLDLRAHPALLVVSEGLGNLVALRSTVPTSCICLTPLKVAYDPLTRGRFFAGRPRPHYRVAFALYALLERPAWRRYRRVFCISHEVRRRVVAAGLADLARLEVVHPGVDAARFRSDGEREPVFLVPGRMMWQKNVELVIRAWHAFKPSPGDSAFRLVIAGMVDAKSRPYLERLRADARGRVDISFVESPSDEQLLRLYQRAYAVVFPASNEDFGFVPLEAMASGAPVLATARGGPCETVVDGETGFLRPDEPDAFARAMTELARMPRAELERMRRAARSRACEFPWDLFVRRIDSHVEELAGASALAPSARAVRAEIGSEAAQ